MDEFTVVAHNRDLIGEVPIWCDRTSTLWWIDVLRPALYNFDPATDKIRTFTLHGGRIGSIALRENGGLLVANAGGLHLFDPTTGSQDLFVSNDQLAPNQFFNDGRCDRQGRFWVGTMHESFNPEGVLLRVDADGTLTEWLGEIIVPNGIAFSLDDLTMYFADTRRFAISAFDFDADAGAISNRRPFAQTVGRPGRPDGSCVDSEGFLWNAEYAGGQITRFAPDGTIDRTVMTPVSHPTSLCFGGPDFDTLYITSGCFALTPEQAAQEEKAGAVLAFKPGVRGVPEPRFRG
jgi:sugar lactone lactonase YvrE